MGLPQIIIEFKNAGATAIRRSSRGTVVLLLPGTGEATTFRSFAQAEEAGLSGRNLLLARLCFLGGPAKLHLQYYDDLTVGMQAAAATTQEGWICAPDADPDAVSSAIRLLRDQGSVLRAVVANADNPDCAGIVNFAASNIRITLDDAITDITDAEYTLRIAGILAGLSLSRSATYLVLPEVVDFSSSADPDADIAAGKLILYRGSSSIRLGRAVTSLVTLTTDLGADFQKIKIVEGVDLIRSDIRRVFEEQYIGQVLNDYDSKLLLITAINGYLHALEGSVLDAAYDNSAAIDHQAQRLWLEQQGVDTDAMSSVELVKANTGSHVFLTATLRFADAMEDLRLQVSM